MLLLVQKEYGTLSSTTDFNPTFVAGAGNGAVKIASRLQYYPIEGTLQSALPASYYEDRSTGSMADSRDGQIYTVAKLGDNLWMTRNLAIGCNGSGSTYGSNFSSESLDSSSSNVSTTWSTPTLSLVKSDNTTGCTTRDDSGCNSYNDARMKCDVTYGAWYNYAAASAGTIVGGSRLNDVYNICPAGWTMPSGAQIRDVWNNWDSYSDLFEPVAVGYYSSGVFWRGSGGRWWSSSSDGGSGGGRQHLGYNGSVSSIGYSDPSLGYHVRCVRSE